MIDTTKRLTFVKRLMYIWRNCFANNIKNVKTTNIIEHFIDFKSNVRLIRNNLFKYISTKRKFANWFFLELKDAKIIIKKNNSWKVKSKFSFKKKKSTLLRIMYNFISINKYIIKFVYFMHHFEKILVIFIQSKYKVFFFSNATNEYWTISMKTTNENKIDFLTFNEQWIYLRISQKLKKASHIYVQFSNIIFDSLFSNDENIIRMMNLIENHENHFFSVFVNNHDAFNVIYETLFTFLHTCYFSRCAFDSIYLFESKTHLFANNLKVLKFQEDASNFRSSIKHKNKIVQWSMFKNRAKLNVFLWLIFFLRIFISNKAKHVIIMKKIYLTQIIDEFKSKLNHDEKFEKCEQNFIKTIRARKLKKTNIRQK